MTCKHCGHEDKVHRFLRPCNGAAAASCNGAAAASCKCEATPDDVRSQYGILITPGYSVRL